MCLEENPGNLHDNTWAAELWVECFLFPSLPSKHECFQWNAGLRYTTLTFAVFYIWANGHSIHFPEASQTVNRRKRGIAANLITEYWKGQRSAPNQYNFQNESYQELLDKKKQNGNKACHHYWHSSLGKGATHGSYQELEKCKPISMWQANMGCKMPSQKNCPQIVFNNTVYLG